MLWGCVVGALPRLEGWGRRQVTPDLDLENVWTWPARGEVAFPDTGSIVISKGVVWAGCVHAGVTQASQSHRSPTGFGEIQWGALDSTYGCRSSLWEVIGSPEASRAKGRQVRFVFRPITLATVRRQMDHVPSLAFPPSRASCQGVVGSSFSPSIPVLSANSSQSLGVRRWL